MKKLFSLAVLGAFALAGAAQNSVVYKADALLEQNKARRCARTPQNLVRQPEDDEVWRDLQQSRQVLSHLVPAAFGQCG